MDSGFLNVVEIGQQWLVVSTLCQEMKKHVNRKVGSEGNTKIGPVLEVTTSNLQGKFGVEIRIESVNKDNSHSWVRISHGLNKFIVIIGLIISGRGAWQEEEETRKDFSIVLIHQEQSCTSELFKVIKDAVSWILLYRTMSLFRTVSPNTFIMSDVQSIHIPSSIQD